MALNVGTITAKFEANVTDLQAGINKAQKEVSSLGGTFEGAGNKMGAFFSKAGDQAKTLTTVLAGLAAIGVGAVAVAVKKGVEDYKAEELIVARLTTLVMNQTGATMENVKALQSQATALQNASVYTDDMVMGAQAQLATFDLTTDTIQKITPALLDFIAGEDKLNATTQDAEHRAQQLGLAFQGNIKGLRGFGFEMTPAQEHMIEFGNEQEKLAAVTQMLGKTYAGQYDMLKNTFGGQMMIASRNYDDFMQVIGGGVVNHLQPLITKFNEWVVSMGGVDGVMTTVKGKVQEFMDTVSNNAGFQAFMVILTTMGNWIVANSDLVLTFLTGVGIALGAMVILTTITAALTLMLSPLTLIIAAVALLYTAWAQNWGGIQEITATVFAWIKTQLAVLKQEWDIWGKDVWAGVKATFGMIWEIIKFSFDLIINLLAIFIDVFTGDWAGAWEGIKKLVSDGWEGVKAIFKSAYEALKGFGAAFVNYFVSQFDDVINKAKKMAEDVRHAIASAFDKDKKNSPSIADKINDLKGFVENNSFGFTPNVIPAGASTVNQTINANINGGMDLAFLGEKMRFAMRSNY